MKIKLVIIILIVLFLNTLLYSGVEDNTINVIFRVDDYGIDSEEFYKTLFNSFKENNLPLVVGVVPYRILQESSISEDVETIQPMSDRAVNILHEGLQSCNIEIGQHGYCHDNVLHEKKIYSEFAGLDYDTQYNKIRKGKNFLEKTFPVRINTFIPPWNSYDKTTLMVLRDLKFESISASCDKKGVITDSTLKYIPYTIDLPYVKDAIREARKSKSPLSHIIVVLFHAYDFYENQGYYDQDYTYDDNLSEKTFIHYHEFEELLSWIKNQSDVRVTSFRDIAQTEIDLGWKKFLDNRSVHKLLPAPDFVYPDYYSYLSFNDVSRNMYQIMYTVYPMVFYIVLLVISIIFGYGLAYLLNLVSHKLVKIIYSIVTLLFVILFVYSLRDLVLGYRAIMLITIFLGLYTGYFLYFHHKVETRKKE